MENNYSIGRSMEKIPVLSNADEYKFVEPGKSNELEAVI